MTGSVRSRVWASGFRNPFRFAFHPSRTDRIYVSENGDSTDRVSMVRAGGNGLWNGNDNGGFLTVNAPLFKVLHTGAASLIGIEIITSGSLAFNAKPTLYLGNWLGGISRFTLSDSTSSQGTEWNTLATIPAGGASFWDSAATAMDLQLGADGHLYYTHTNGDASLGGWYALRRYRFAGGTPPNASFTTDLVNSRGEAPLLVSFTDSTTQGTNTLTSWHWNFGDGNTSSIQNPTHTYNTPGTYTATLTVTDSVGLNDNAQMDLEVTTSTTISLSLNILDGRTLATAPVTSPFTITFFQMDGTSPLPFSGGTGTHSNQLLTLADGTYSGSLNLPLVDSGFVMMTENLNSPGFQNITRGVSVSLGVANTVTESFYVSSASLSGRVLSLRGNPANVDLGIRSAGQPFPFAGGRDYLSNSALPATGILHRLSTDDLGYFSIPIPLSEVGTSLDLTFVEDTGRGIYATRNQTVASQANTNLNISLNVAEWLGGSADDLSGQAFTPSVNYSAIQTIFSANCTGCHRASTTNNGGLDLTSGNSYAELVDQLSLFAPGLKLVDPGNPSRSYLFEKINSANPQQGARMRPTDSLPLADQALVRDWITQLAPSYENFVWTNLGVAPGNPNTGVADDINGNGIANGLEYTGLGFGSLAASTDGSSFTGQVELQANSTGLTVIIQSSEDLQPGSWQTIATRLRGQSSWRVTSGFSVSEISTGLLQMTDSTDGINTRFYRLGTTEQ